MLGKSRLYYYVPQAFIVHLYLYSIGDSLARSLHGKRQRIGREGRRAIFCPLKRQRGAACFSGFPAAECDQIWALYFLPLCSLNCDPGHTFPHGERESDQVIRFGLSMLYLYVVKIATLVTLFLAQRERESERSSRGCECNWHFINESGTRLDISREVQLSLLKTPFN